MRLATLRCGLLIALWACAAAVRAQDASLSTQIDQLVEAAAVGPVAPPAGDADFLRRCYLDLIGVIPTAADARAFLADKAPDKRAKLIDQLLASPQYARHMALVFDVMLMERGPEKVIKTPQWQTWLQASFAADKPLDQLCREMLATDGADEALRPAVRFVIDRDCEPNLVTRDISRIMLGRDITCAQCHDHPHYDDYLQKQYYGLFAFVLRSSLGNDAQKKLPVIAEKPDGETSYKSVFTGDAADKVLPRLPGETTPAPEPAFAKGQEYAVAPAKDVRAIPKYSRRAQLAERLVATPDFRRNMANRLWAHMLGRGIVHPVELHHIANPPANPELLSLLAKSLADSKFSAKTLLRQIALSKTYQRSCDAPQPASANLPPAADALAKLAPRKAAADEAVTKLTAAATEAKTAFQVINSQYTRQQTELAALQKTATEAQALAEKAAADKKAADEALAKKQTQVAAVSAAATKAQEAAAQVAGDAILAKAAADIAARGQVLTQEAATAAQQVAALTAAATAAAEKQTVAAVALAKASVGLLQREQLVRIEQGAIDADQQLIEARYIAKSLESQAKTLDLIAKLQQVAAPDPAAVEETWRQLIDRWTQAGQIAHLRPLSCEQFSLSMMQATGVMQSQVDAARQELEKALPENIQQAPEADRPRLLAAAVEAAAFEKLRGSLNGLVSLYGAEPGSEFQATANQALYFENSAQIQNWVKQSGGNLTDRLTKLTDPALLSEELYLSILTRFPTDDEKQEVAAYLKDRSDRNIAVSELVWALLSSNEFRFNH